LRRTGRAPVRSLAIEVHTTPAQHLAVRGTV